MVFARTGHMDRAVDFVRRALFCYEISFIEQFKPVCNTYVYICMYIYIYFEMICIYIYVYMSAYI
jgi:hypothetical protein